MRIVDAQIHLWGSGLPSNMAHRQVTSFTTEEAVRLMVQPGALTSAPKRVVLRIVPEKVVSWDHRKLGGRY